VGLAEPFGPHDLGSTTKIHPRPIHPLSALDLPINASDSMRRKDIIMLKSESSNPELMAEKPSIPPHVGAGGTIGTAAANAGELPPTHFLAS
jgi:hypothetical protein